MKKPNIIENLGFERATSINLDSSSLSESQLLTIEKVQGFDIDSIYFCTDNLNNSHPAVFLKKVTSFDTETLKAISNTHKKIWNYKKVVFLYVYSDTEIRIYNCAEKPLIISSEKFNYQKELKKLEIKSYKLSDKEKLEELNNLFSSIAIDTGIIWTIEEAELIRKKINLQRRVDKYLVESLIRTAKQLQNEGLEIDFIHKIIMRSLFLLYLEDRGATKDLYSEIRRGAKSYFDILDNVEDTYALFEKLEDYFNGNVFTLGKGETITVKQLQLIKNCFINGNDNTAQTQLFNDRLFDFKIIQIELLSEIYENFLSKINPDKKKKTGTHYTPPSLVELILNEKLPINNKETAYNVKTLDPSCGSGIFLVESFKRLVKRYENNHKIEKLTDFKILSKLLTSNIFGIEIDPQSIKVTAFSLYLALIDELNPKTFWQNKNYRLPYLINDLEDDLLKNKQGKNLYRRDTIETNSKIESIEFDLVVGNPPFGTKDLLPSIRDYSDKYGFAKEMVLPFLHKAAQFSKKGEIVLIFNTKVLTNTGGTYQKFRKWLFNDCYVEKIYNFSILRKVPKGFGGQLFGSATGPISIVFYKKEKPKNPSKTILYYAPKTFIKSNVIEGVSIDSTDVKYLPIEECQKPDTKIWKVAMWGGMNDWNLINKIGDKFESNIYNYLKINQNNFSFGSGLHSPSKKQILNNKIFTPKKVINLRKVKRYYTNENSIENTNKTFRLIDDTIFKPPFILIKEGQKNKEYCVSFIDYNSFHTGYSISPKNEDNIVYIKLWCALINSRFAKYFLSLTSSSWGIERERVQANETLTLPSLNNIDKSNLKEFELLFNELIVSHKNDLAIDTFELENKIDSYLLKNILKLTKNEINSINDIIDYSLDLLENKHKSKALFPVLELGVINYVNLLSERLNHFLENQNLFANATIFNLSRFSPLMMIKISFSNTKEEIKKPKESIESELKKIDEKLWEEKATNIYFRKKLNYKIDNDIYIIRPNQRRFWSQSMALEDASELILEILNEV
ncbi:MAG: SAM-dependent methyltransferase [Flavobacteriaceae bacterium]|nr:SAM-dependent methyltransferase [Flavobacteriaceae bacterium]